MRKLEWVAEDLIKIGDWLGELHEDLVPGTPRRWAENDRRDYAEDGSRLPLPAPDHCYSCGRRMYRRPDRQLTPLPSTDVVTVPGYQQWNEEKQKPEWVPPVVATVKYPDGPVLDGDLVYGDKVYCRVCDVDQMAWGETRAPVRALVEHVLDVEVGSLLELEGKVRAELGDSIAAKPAPVRRLRRHAASSQVRRVTLVKGGLRDPEYIAGGWRYIERGEDPDAVPAISAARYLSRRLDRIERFPDLYMLVSTAAQEIAAAIDNAVGNAPRRRKLDQRCPICELPLLVAMLDDNMIVCTANRAARGDFAPEIYCECAREECGCHRGRRHEYLRCLNGKHPGDCNCGWERLGIILETREGAS